MSKISKWIKDFEVVIVAYCRQGGQEGLLESKHLSRGWKDKKSLLKNVLQAAKVGSRVKSGKLQLAQEFLCCLSWEPWCRATAIQRKRCAIAKGSAVALGESPTLESLR